MEEGESKAIEPRKALAEVFVADAGLVFSISDIETPVAGVLNAPVTANGTCKAFHTDRQAAQAIANFIGDLTIAHTMKDHQTDGFQAGPLVETRQVLGGRQLNVRSRFVTSVSLVVSHTAACLYVGEIVFHVFGDLVHHRFMQLAVVPALAHLKCNGYEQN